MTEVGPEFDAELIHTAQQILSQEVQARGWSYDLSQVRLLARGSAWADLDGDGRKELCFTAGIPKYGGPAMCGIVRLRNDGQVAVRTLISCEEGLRDLVVSDINHDGIPEILVRWQADFGMWLKLYVLQFDGNLVTSLFPNLRFRQGFMELKDLNGDGLDEIVVWSSVYETNPLFGPQRFDVSVFQYDSQDYKFRYQHRTERRYLPASILQQRISLTGISERYYQPPTSAMYRQKLEDLRKSNQVDHTFVVELGLLASELHREGFATEALDIIGVLLEAVRHLSDDAERHRFSFQAWETRGNICMWIGLWQEAIDSYLRALALAAKGLPAGIDPVYEPTMQRQLGWVYSREGDYSNALARFSIADELLKSMDQAADTTKAELSRLRSNRALAYAYLGDHDLAEASFREAIALDEELGRPQQLALNYTGLGNVQRDRGDYPGATMSYNEALGALTNLSERDRESDIYLEWGLTLILQDKAEQALPLLRTALLLTSVPNLSHHAAAHYLYLGEAYRASGDLHLAADFFGTAAKLAQEYSTPETRWQALYKLALIAEVEGQLEECKNVLELCISNIESLRSQYLPESLKITLLAQKVEPYESMTRFLLSRARQSDSEEEKYQILRGSFAYIEQAKSRVFVEQLAMTAIRPAGVSTELLDEEARLLRSLRSFRALHTAGAAEQQYLWGQEISEIESKLNKLWDKMSEESNKGAEYVELRRAVPADHSSVREMLRNR